MADSQQLPRIDFTTFILSISSAAFRLLEQKGDLEIARQNIDLLSLMWEKTRGNRTAEEEKLLEQLLFETRMRFVEAQKKREPGK